MKQLRISHQSSTPTLITFYPYNFYNFTNQIYSSFIIGFIDPYIIIIREWMDVAKKIKIQSSFENKLF